MKSRGIGKIKSVPIEHPTEGMHVYWTGCPSKVKMWIIQSFNKNTAIVSPNINSPRAQSPYKSELRNLVIEYKNYYPNPPKNNKEAILDIETDLYYQLEQIQLGFIDWKKAIKNNLIDGDVSVPFTIHVERYGLGWSVEEATINIDLSTDKSKRIFTEEDMLKAFEAGEYKMEYPQTAPDFDYFIDTMKNIIRTADDVS